MHTDSIFLALESKDIVNDSFNKSGQTLFKTNEADPQRYTTLINILSLLFGSNATSVHLVKMRLKWNKKWILTWV